MDGQLDESRSRLIEVLSFDVARSGAWANLGDVFAKMGNQEDAVAAFKLSYYFSRAPEKTVEFFKKRSEDDVNEKIRSASSMALMAFSSIQPMIAHP
jgi:predicted Zn-dependent protease